MLGRKTSEHPDWSVMCFKCLTITKIKNLLFIGHKSHSDIFSEACPKCKKRVWAAVWDENGNKR